MMDCHADYLKFPRENPTVGLPCWEYPTENSHLLRYPFTRGDSSIPSSLHGRPPADMKIKDWLSEIISYQINVLYFNC